jgi:small subunit ribosomal protein S6
LRRYETIFIVPADTAEDELNGLVEKCETIITTLKGTFVKRESWGKRKLAYEIRKHTRGFYTLLDFVATSDVVDELERNLRLDDKVLKYLTVKKDDAVDLQALEREMTAAQPEKKEEAPSEMRITKAPSESQVAEKTPEAEAVAAEEAAAPPTGAADESQTETKGGNE